MHLFRLEPGAACSPAGGSFLTGAAFSAAVGCRSAFLAAAVSAGSALAASFSIFPPLALAGVLSALADVDAPPLRPCCALVRFSRSALDMKMLDAATVVTGASWKFAVVNFPLDVMSLDADDVAPSPCFSMLYEIIYTSTKNKY